MDKTGADDRTLIFGYVPVTKSPKESESFHSAFYVPFNKAFCYFDDLSINVWDPVTSKTLHCTSSAVISRSHKITSLVFVKSHEVYLATTEDFKLLVFGLNLFLIKTVQMKVRLVHFMHFVEETSNLIVAGVDGCFLVKFEYESRYKAKQALVLDPEGKHVKVSADEYTPFAESHPWVKGLKVIEDTVLYWTDSHICLHNTHGKLLRSYKGILADGLPSDMTFMAKYQYLIIGLRSGYLNVCKYLTNLSTLFNLKAHLKPVTALILHPTCANMIMSGATDGFIKIWNIEKQAEVFSLSLECMISSITFMDSGHFHYTRKKKLYIGKLKLITDHVITTNTPILGMKSVLSPQTPKESKILINCEDASSYILDYKGNLVTTIFPPPSAKNILSLDYSFTTNKAYILLANGSICIYQVDQETALIETIQSVNQIQDKEGRPLNGIPTILLIRKCIAHRYDSELGAYALNKYLSSVKETDNSYQEREYLILGTGKGQVVFINFEDLSNIHSKVAMTTNPIKAIDLLSKDVYLTLNNLNTFFIWSVKSGKLEVFHELRLGADLLHFTVLSNRIFLAYSSGDQELLEWNEPELYVVQFVKELDHEKRINCIDSNQSKNAVVTCSDDGLVKVWDYRRQLIRQIRFPYKLAFSVFMNFGGDILVCHQNSVSVIRSSTYYPKNVLDYGSDEEFLIKVTGDDIRKELAKAAEVDAHFKEEKKVEENGFRKLTKEISMCENESKSEAKSRRASEIEKLFRLSLKSTTTAAAAAIKV